MKRKDYLENELVHDPEVSTSLAWNWDSLYNLDVTESGLQQTSTETSEKRSCRDSSTEDQDGTRYPQRSRTAVAKPGFVYPGNVFSSSSPPRSSQDVPPSSQTEGYAESMSPRGVVLENYAVRLVFCILRHVFYHCQKPDSSYVEVRERQRASVTIGGREFTAIDHGGLCLTSPGRNKTLKSIFLIEAKRRLEVSQDRVVVSDSVLGLIL